MAGFLAFLPIINTVIEKLFPDPNVAAEAKFKLLDLQQKGELAWLDADVKLAVGQMEVNKVEAADPSWFKSGWRPFVGWTCGAAFAYSYVLLPFLEFFVYLWADPVTVAQMKLLPKLDITTMLPVLFGMLGLGGMRTAERLQGKV